MGVLPDKKYYRIDETKDTKRKELFEKWYQEESKKYADGGWCFMEQARLYCNTDVQILRLGMRTFRQKFMELTKRPGVKKEEESEQKDIKQNQGVDPLRFPTIASAVQGAFRTVFMAKDTIANFSAAVDKVLRLAQHGGRTDCDIMYWESKESKEGLCYVDVNSLYPAVMVKYLYPVGYPTLFGDPAGAIWPEHACQIEAPAVLNDLERIYLREGTLAILCVDVTCPSNLKKPVLGDSVKQKGDPARKFLFDLKPKTKYWSNSPELRKALELGYEVTAVHAVAWWPEEQCSFELWGDYFKKFVPIKDANSGYPKGWDEKEFREAYKLWPENQGAELKHEDIKLNPGMKNVTKLFLNTLWGKMSMRMNQSRTTVFKRGQTAEFFSLIMSDQWRIQRLVPIYSPEKDERPVGDDVDAMEVVYCRPPGFEDDEGPDKGTLHVKAPHAVHLGIFVTAYARLELYGLIELAGDTTVYYDTDSLIFHNSVMDQFKPLMGPFLGQLKDELDGDFIKKWACSGPKAYCYETQKGKTKSVIKGMRRSALSAQFQFLFIKTSCIAHCIGQDPPRPFGVSFSRIKRDRVRHEVKSEPAERRTYRYTANKRQVFANGTTLPYGHAAIVNQKYEQEMWRADLNDKLFVLSNELEVLRKKQNEAVDMAADEAKEEAKEAQRDKNLARLERKRHEAAIEFDPDLLDINLGVDECALENDEWMLFEEEE